MRPSRHMRSLPRHSGKSVRSELTNWQLRY